MAKKKKRKEEVKTNNYIELYGILLIVIVIYGRTKTMAKCKTGSSSKKKSTKKGCK